MTDFHPHIKPDKLVSSEQKWICISFLKPQMEKLELEKCKFYNHLFLCSYARQVRSLTEFRLSNPDTKLTEIMKSTLDPTEQELTDLYLQFITENKEKLDEDFNKEFNKENFVTERAVKVRGAFETQEEAMAHAKKLSKMENGLHNVYVAKMGTWLLFDPEKAVDIDYIDNTLNELLKKKDDERVKADLEYYHRKNKLIDATNKETKEKKQKVLKKTKPKKLTEDMNVDYLPLFKVSELKNFYKELGFKKPVNCSKDELIDKIKDALSSQLTEKYSNLFE